MISGACPRIPRSPAISVVSIAELHFGVLRARDDDERALRLQRLGLVEARYPSPLPIDDLIAREWGRLQAAIAATARVHGARLLTHDVKDFAIVDDLVAVAAA
ncbi:MAG: type toxin-antitoxin system VapC family toxin [Conexibacter sp.]|nr:type toxin-antitoxin system VapC family toxin [Conexibacter sp.]